MSSDNRNDPEPDAQKFDGGMSVDDLDVVRDALRGLRFGQVTIIVQDGVIIQVDRMERKRLK
jgi:hypothetical protein